MKRAACLLLAYAFISLFSLACAFETELSDTEHFIYSAPKEWIKQTSDNFVFYYAEDVGSTNGGYITACEYTVDNLISYTGDLDIFYNSMIDAAVCDNGSGRVIVDAEIDGRQAKLALGGLKTEYATYDAAYVFLVVNQYVFSQIYIDPQKTPSDLFETIKTLSSNIQLKENVTESKTPDVLFEDAVREIWNGNIISVKAGKYPDFTVYQTGSSEHIRFESEEKILELLRRIDQIRKSAEWDFVDIFIRVHTDLIDIYGNERVGEVITIKFTPETLDKINYENVSKYNLPLIADVWREHPAME